MIEERKRIVDKSTAYAITILVYEFSEFLIVDKEDKKNIYNKINSVLKKPLNSSTIERYLKYTNMVQFKDGELILFYPLNTTRMFYKQFKELSNKNRTIMSLKLNGYPDIEKFMKISRESIDKRLKRLNQKYPNAYDWYTNRNKEKSESIEGLRKEFNISPKVK